MSEFTRERYIKSTRGQHRCLGCGQRIEVGSKANYFAMKANGQFDCGYYHHDCREAEVALNHRLDTWGEDWTPLDNIMEGDEAEDDWQWLVEAFPTVATRFTPSTTGDA